MKTPMKWTIALVLLAGIPHLQAQGYSVQGTFDTSRVIALSGVIKKIHGQGGLTYLFVDVKDENGNAVPWMLRLSAPSLLNSRGFAKTSFRIGSPLTVEVWPEKNPPRQPLPQNSLRNIVPAGVNFGAAWKLTFEDGKVLDEASRPAAPWPAEPEIFPSQR